MEKQVDRHILEETFSVTNLSSLVKGYILNCRSEGKSPQTIKVYQTVLNNFLWYSHQNDFPEKITTVHIRHFLWYLSTETNRWEGKTANTKKPASMTTVNDYYRALNSFFNWLLREQFGGTPSI